MNKSKFIILGFVLFGLIIVPIFYFVSFDKSSKKSTTEQENVVVNSLRIEPFNQELYNQLTAEEYTAFKNRVYDYLINQGDKSPTISINSVDHNRDTQNITIDANNGNNKLNIVIKYTETQAIIIINNNYQARLL